MKRRRYIAIFIFILSLCLCKSISLKLEDINGGVGCEKYFVGLRSSFDAKNGFSYDETKELERILSPESIIFYTFDKISISSERSTDEALVCGIKGSFDDFYNVKLKRGAFLNYEDNDNKNNAVVIEDRLAKKLFGSDDIVGLEIELYNKKFTVIGVTTRDASITGEVIESELPYVYLPLSTMNDIKPDLHIVNLEFKALGNSLNKALVKDKLAAAGKNADEFYIKDYYELGKLTKQGSDIIFFIIGMFCIWKLIVFIMDNAKMMIGYLRMKLKEDYFIDIAKKHRGSLIKNLIMAAALIAIILIWKEISFSLYIAPKMMPDDPTSASQLFKIFVESIKEYAKISDVNVFPEYRITEILQQLSGIFFAVCILCWLYLVFHISKNKYDYLKGRMEAICKMSICFAVSLILSAVLVITSGLPIGLSIKDIILLWGSVLIICILSDNKSYEIFYKERDILMNSDAP